MAAFSLETRPGNGRTHVVISGLVDEQVDLTPIIGLDGVVELNLKGIRRLNSAGVRVWVDALRVLSKRARVEVIEASPAVVDQLNMISGFLGGGTLRSFYGPMVCERCDKESNHLFEASEVRELDRLPPVTCATCKQTLELDDDEDRYIHFLREPTRVG